MTEVWCVEWEGILAGFNVERREAGRSGMIDGRWCPDGLDRRAVIANAGRAGSVFAQTRQGE
jgi:hypothetical protein